MMQRWTADWKEQSADCWSQLWAGREGLAERGGAMAWCPSCRFLTRSPLKLTSLHFTLYRARALTFTLISAIYAGRESFWRSVGVLGQQMTWGHEYKRVLGGTYRAKAVKLVFSLSPPAGKISHSLHLKNPFWDKCKKEPYGPNFATWINNCTYLLFCLSQHCLLLHCYYHS